MARTSVRTGHIRKRMSKAGYVKHTRVRRAIVRTPRRRK